MIYDKPLYLPAGDQTLIVELGDEINLDINRRVHMLTKAVQQTSIQGIVDIIPTYKSILIQYDILQTNLEDLQKHLMNVDESLDATVREKTRIIHLPTLYTGDYGPDLAFVAEHAGLTIEEAVHLHSSSNYPVYMMGFTPGFPYLGGLSKTLATPRLKTPRVTIPAGSVGIAENQTGVYPVASPGGWQIIGRTPLLLFDPNQIPPSVINAGDYVKFVPISNDDEYQRLRKLVDKGEYKPTIEVYE